MKAKLVKESLSSYINEGRKEFIDWDNNNNYISSKEEMVALLADKNATITNVKSWADEYPLVIQYSNVMQALKEASKVVGIDLIKDCYAWDDLDEDVVGDFNTTSLFRESNFIEVSDVITKEYEVEEPEDEDEYLEWDAQEQFIPYSSVRVYWDKDQNVGMMSCNPYFETNDQDIFFIPK